MIVFPSLLRAIERRAVSTLYVPRDRPRRPRIGDRLTLRAGDERLRVDITEVEEITLGAVDETEARQCGFWDPDGFAAGFVQCHDRPWWKRQYGYLISKDVPTKDALDATAVVAVTRYDVRWVGHTAFRCTIRPAVDLPLLLAPSASPRGDEHGYTQNRHSALPDEPEAIDTAVLQKSWREAADIRHRTATSDRRSGEHATRLSLPNHQRIGAAVRVAKAERRDVSNEAFLVRRAISEGRSESAIERRITALEAVAYH